MSHWFKTGVLVAGLMIVGLPMKVTVPSEIAPAYETGHGDVSIEINEACAQGTCSGACSCKYDPLLSCRGVSQRKCECPAR